jgi:hypothetical protein
MRRLVAFVRRRLRPAAVPVELFEDEGPTPTPYPQPGPQALAEDIRAFEYWLDEHANGGSSPVILRRLVLASIKLMNCHEPLPAPLARTVKRVTGVKHKTYATAVQGLFARKFDASGLYWATFLVGRSLYPFPEESGDMLTGSVLELSTEPGRAASWDTQPHEWAVRKPRKQ